jgi:hypothetical protein
MLMRLFTEHPESVGETYFEHVGVAFSFSMKMLFGAMVCLVHAVLPFLFVKTGSELITELHDRMVANRNPEVDKASEPVSEGGAF